METRVDELRCKLATLLRVPLARSDSGPHPLTANVSEKTAAAIAAANVVFAEVEAEKQRLSRAIATATPGDLRQIKSDAEALATREMDNWKSVLHVAGDVELAAVRTAAAASAERDKAVAELLTFLRKRFGLDPAVTVEHLAGQRIVNTSPVFARAATASAGIGAVGCVTRAARERLDQLQDWQLSRDLA